MNHKQFKEWLQLSLYDELNEQEKKVLNKHLKSCEQCQADLQGLKKLHTLLAYRKSIPVEKSILQDARKALHLRIRKNSTVKFMWEKLKGSIDGVLTPPLQIAVSGITILVAGILIGYFIFKSPAEKSLGLHQISSSSSVMEAGESQVSNIRFINRDLQTGTVDFTFETVTPVHVRGSVNDENIQKVLARALVNDQNTGIRLRAVNMIGTQTKGNHNDPHELDAEVKSALISALLHDGNLGVRREALGVLKHYLPDTTIVRAFLIVLANEKNTALKIAAINSLDINEYENQPMNKEILEMLRQKAQSNDNNYIKIKAKAALQEVKQ